MSHTELDTNKVNGFYDRDPLSRGCPLTIRSMNFKQMHFL